jgi:hypothetical protein
MTTYTEAYEARKKQLDELHQQFLDGDIDPSDYMHERLVLEPEVALFAFEHEFIKRWKLDREEWDSLSDNMKKVMLRVGRQVEKYDLLVDQVKEWVGDCPV